MWLQQPPLGVPLNFEDPLNKGLVLHLANNEGHGDVVRDLSLWGNHGKLHNFAYPSTVASGWNPGRDGVGLNYDGSNDHINCGNQASLNLGTDDFTISAAIRTTNIASQTIYGDYIAGGGVLFFTNNGNLWLWSYGATGSTEGGTVGQNVCDGDHHQVHITRLVGDKYCFYIDGVYISSIADTTTGTLSTGNNKRIGLRGNDAYPFNGHIAYTRILNRAYTAKEVMQRQVDPWGVYVQPEDL